MYCPKCANLAADAALKFCPRCGLALAGVREALARESGALASGKGRTAFRKGLRRGFKCLLWGMAAGGAGYLLATTVIFLSELTRPGDVKRELLVPLRYAFLAAYFLCPGLTLFGVVRMLYAVAFERNRDDDDARGTRVREAEGASLLEEAHHGATPLPPHQRPSRPPVSVGRGECRSELAHLSVTEQTTGLL
jgi:hypothetical protein